MPAMPGQKVVFLDVDGVCHAADMKHRPFRAPCMNCLEEIVKQSGAEIVLSSNWRLETWGIDLLNKRLRQNGMDPVIGTTHPEEDHFNTRADEILDYLHRHAEVTHFVVLDDVDLCFEDDTVTVPECIATHFVLTDENFGLRPADVVSALECLDRSIDRSSLPPAQLYNPGGITVGITPTTLSELNSAGPIVEPPVLASKPLSRTNSLAQSMELLGTTSKPMSKTSSALSLKSMGLSRRSSRGDLEGLVRD